MDINDPRYRLKVLNQSNPSIRIATSPAPKQTIQVSNQPARTPNIIVPNAPPAPSNSQPTYSWNAPESPKSSGFGGFFKSAAHLVSDPFKPIASGIARLLPGGQNDIKANEDLSAQLDRNQQTYNALLKQGKINKEQYAKLTQNNAGGYSDVSKEANRIADTADMSQALGSAAMVPLSIFAPGGSLIRNIGAGAGFGALNELATQKDPTLKGAAVQTVAGGATGGLLDRFGAAGSKLLNKVTGKGGDVISKIVAETNPTKLVKRFGIPEEAAGFLANETNPETVKLVLDEMTQQGIPIKGWWEAPQKEIDPNAPPPTDLTPGMFDASNPPLSYLPPGMHAPGGVDPVPVMTEKAQGFKSALEFDAYVRGLEGEERVLAANALNGKTPEEFYNAVKGNHLLTTNESKLLPEKASLATKASGEGFTMAPETNQAAVEAGKRLAQIDRKLHAVNIGKGSLTGEEARALTQEKQSIIDNLSNAGTKDAAAKIEQTAAEVKPSGQPVGEALPPEDVAAIKAAGGEVPPAPAVPQSGTSTPAPKGDIPAQDAKTMFPGLDDTQAAAVQKVMDSLHPAKKAYDVAVKARKVETASRFARADKNFEEAGGGAEGFYSKFKALGGKKTASEWAGADLTKEEGDALHNLVQGSDLMSGEKFNTQKAIEKVWGKNPQKPADHDINYIRRFFNEKLGGGVGDELANAMQEAAQSKMGWRDIVAGIAGLPKTLMATFDFSAPRQAGALAARHPVMFLQEYGKSFKAAFNPEYYNKYMKEIADDPSWSVISDDMGVNLPGVTGKQEEKYANAQLAEKIPGYGKTIVKGSNRSYNALLTGLRFRAAKNTVEVAGGPEQYTKVMESLYGDSAKEATQRYGEMINTLSGRGGAKSGVLERHMTTASKALFSPRLWAANIQRLNPIWYAQLARSNPAAAKEAAIAQATFLSMVGTTLYLASKAPGVDVGTDMRSADFGKIKIGNTRFDIMGGQQQNIVQAWRQWTGEKVNSETGEVSQIGGTFAGKDRFDLFVDMLISKSNPLINFAVGLSKSSDNPDSSNPLNRVDQYGQEMNVAASTGKLAVPLNISGMKQTTDDTGSIAKGIGFNLPGFFGAGVNTYGNTKTKDKGQPDAKGHPTFSGKITPDMVTDASGQAILDEKGKTIKVKYPADASEREKKAIMNNARDKAYNKVAISQLSKDDKAIYEIGNKDKTMLSTDEQKKYAQVKKWVESYGKASQVPEGVTSDYAKDFYKKYQTMTKDDQKYWLEKGKPSDVTVALTKELNSQRSKGLSEYKPSNALAKAYAEYEKDINTHPDYTEVDKRNKAKAFQVHAYKLNYSNNQRDIYQEGSSSDVKTLLAEGQISKEDLANAIQMDNELYASGLTGSLKFSKSFRRTFGFGIPATYGSSGGSGSGGRRGSGGGSGGSGSSSNNAHLTAYIPSDSTAPSGGDVPKFSSRSRAATLPSFTNVNLPKGTGSGKVNIRL